MTGLVGTAALWAATALGAPLGAPAVDSLVGPGPAVPFVAQGSLLCGGAAAAMLERFWGARGVYAEDYAHLVREDEGGIRTTDLALALRHRGHRVQVIRNDPERVLVALADGIPAMILLGESSPTLHYVVLTAASPSEIRFHDPKLGPDRSAPRAELLARWAASGYWALLTQPASGPSAAPGAGATVDSTKSSAAPSERLPSADVERGAPSPVLHPAAAAAMERLRSGDFTAASALAGGIIDEEPPGADARLARRILATARFRSGDADGALEEWNRLSEPLVDLVDIRGASGTRHDVLAAQAGLLPTRLLTRASLALARRRLVDLPSVESSRIAYQPLPDGTVEVRGFVAESAAWPSRLALATQAGQALLDDRVEWELGPHLGLGERWRVHGGWSTAQRRAGSSFAAPLSWPVAVATVSVEWVRERYDLGSADPGAPGETLAAERLRSGIALRRWIHPRLRLEGGAWLERWNGSRRMASARASALSLLGHGEDVRFDADIEGWVGHGDLVGRASLRAAWALAHGERRESRVSLGGTVTSRSAPRPLWPGAGTGQIRAPLLRGHPLAAGGAIDGAAFAPSLLHGTLEHRVFERLGPLRLGGAAFVDAARVSGDPREGSSRTFVDVGLGAFVTLGSREAMISLAAGASGPVLSARVGAWPAG